MEQTSKKRTLPFLTARALVSRRYSISLDKDDFIERAYYIWRTIGNIATQDKKFPIVVPEDGVIELPKDCEFVRSVSSADLLPNTFENTMSGKNYYNSEGYNKEVRPDESMLSAESAARISPSYTHGTTISYSVGDGYIQVDSAVMRNRTVTIIYSAIDKDADDLPLLSDKEVEAIATNIALQEVERRLFQGVKGMDKMLQYLKPEADRLLLAAKSDEKINDDALDRLLDTKTSWDRKVYGRRWNAIK